jgi:hypothetical protein
MCMRVVGRRPSVLSVVNSGIKSSYWCENSSLST